MLFVPRHSLTGKNCIINRIAYTGMIGTVQKSKIQYLITFISQYVHIIFQKDAFIGQRSRLIHTKYIHAAKPLHGIDVFNDRLFSAHAQASPCKTGCDHHRQHLRH